MRLFEGNNEFMDDRFSYRAWSAPLLETAEEAEEYIQQFHLEGRTIRDFFLVGFSYMHTEDMLSDTVYENPSDPVYLERAKAWETEDFSGDDLFLQYIESDEPLLIRFEDGDTFEITAPFEHCLQMSMNCIPWGIKAGCNYQNCDADVFFSSCKGQTIRSVEVYGEKTSIYRNGTEQEVNAPAKIILRLDNGIGIAIYGWCYDYVRYDCVDENDRICTLPYRQLRKALSSKERKP